MEAKFRERYPHRVFQDGTFGYYGCVSIVAKVHPALAQAIIRALMCITDIKQYYALLSADRMHISAMEQAIVREVDNINADWGEVLDRKKEDIDDIAADLASCPAVVATVTSVNADDRTIRVNVSLDESSKAFAGELADKKNLKAAKEFHITCGYRIFRLPEADLQQNIKTKLEALVNTAPIKCEPFKVYYSDNVNHLTLWGQNKTCFRPESCCAIM